MLKYETAALQDSKELQRFIELLLEQDVRSYLEIGSKHGGSLWKVANALPVGSRIVSIDLPHGDTSFKESQPHLEDCIEELKRIGYDAHLIIGDSTSKDVVTAVELLGPYDACFIDANHTEPYVRADWTNYGPMACIVAFHDIGWLRAERIGKMPIEVPKVWAELRQSHKIVEIRECDTNNGIGVLWR